VTPEDKNQYMKGLSTPIDELIDMPVDSFLKQKKYHESFRDGWRFSLSAKAKENYDLIRWESGG
jgi:hypothetical protein